jgi:hypothetical protein
LTVWDMFRPGMRAYLVPLVAGIALALSAFLPWVRVGDVSLAGVPDTTALWIVALGVLASVLATLSLITRKNSRHPLLLIGLVALGLMFLSWQLAPTAVAERVLTRSQALAIVEGKPFAAGPSTVVGEGIYLGLIASCAIVGFGLTIIFKRVARPYVVETPDDDV